MPTQRGLERLIFFTDAVVAIAITLLILPLVDAASEASETGLSPATFLVDHLSQLVAFLISFLVIARLWMVHHSLYEHVGSYNRRLVLLSLLWAFTIVLLPLPTAMTAQFDPGPLVVGFYIGTMLASSLTLTLLAITVHGKPALEASGNPISPGFVRASASTTALFFVAFLLGVLVPPVNYFALFLLFLSGPVQALFGRKTATRPPLS